MSGTRKGLLLALIQLALVLGIAGKFWWDREHRPHVWVQAQTYDPDLPIRGRYLAERLTFSAAGFSDAEAGDTREFWGKTAWAYLSVQDNHLVATRSGPGTRTFVYLRKHPTTGEISAVTAEPVLVFVPEHAQMPQLKSGDELWVEVTIPAKGPPRPIRLGVMRDGRLDPLNFN